MNHSVALLGEDGTKDWDLPCFFNRRRDIGDSSDDESLDESSDDDSSDDENSDDSSDSRRSQNDNALDNASQESSPVLEGGDGDAQALLYLEPGCFVVFPLELSNPCSVEVGKIVDIDLTAGDGGEVTVHWYTPARKQKSRRSRYGKGVWSPVFVMEGNRRIPDKGTESVKSACFTFRSLLQSGKLPTAVWAAVEDSVPTPSLGEVESAGEEEDDDEEGGEGGGGGAQLETSRPPPPETAPRPVPPPAPRVVPPANVRLTAAHFRPRRGQTADGEEDSNDGGGGGVAAQL